MWLLVLSYPRLKHQKEERKKEASTPCCLAHPSTTAPLASVRGILERAGKMGENYFSTRSYVGTQILNICCCALFFSKVHGLILCTKDIHISPSLTRTRYLEVVETQFLPVIANRENALVHLNDSWQRWEQSWTQGWLEPNIPRTGPPGPFIVSGQQDCFTPQLWATNFSSQAWRGKGGSHPTSVQSNPKKKAVGAFWGLWGQSLCS